MLFLSMRCRCELRKKIRDAAVPWIPERSVYMDYNATTPVDPSVLGSFERACRKNWGNPSSLHTAGTQGWNELEELGREASLFFGRNEDGFHLCASGTDALGAVIFGLAAASKDCCFIYTNTEHSAVAHPLFHIGRKSPAAPSGFTGKTLRLNVDASGRLPLTELERSLQVYRERSVIVYSPVNHETGALQPAAEIFALADKYDAAVVLDAVQAAARLRPAEWAPYCHAFAVSGHKLYAPKGTALLWKDPDLRIRPVRFGGSQQGGLFPGTENTPGAAALSAALSILRRHQHEELRMLSTLTAEGLEILKKAGVGFNVESPENRAPGVLCLSLPEKKNMENLLFHLNRRGICLSRFSACSERLDGPSSVLRAMGRPDTRCRTSLRISLGRWSKREDFFRLAKALTAADCP